MICADNDEYVERACDRIFRHAFNRGKPVCAKEGAGLLSGVIFSWSQPRFRSDPRTAHDIASLNALFFLCPGLAQPADLADSEGLPDDVCRPAKFGSEIAVGHFETGNSPSHFASTYHLLLIPVEIYLSGSQEFMLARREEIIYSLCRLRC